VKSFKLFFDLIKKFISQHTTQKEATVDKGGHRLFKNEKKNLKEHINAERNNEDSNSKNTDDSYNSKDVFVFKQLGHVCIF